MPDTEHWWSQTACRAADADLFLPHLFGGPEPVTGRSGKGRLFDEKGLAAIVLMIAVTNLFNRLNATTRQVAGAWG